MAGVTTALRRILREYDLSALSERKVRELMAEKFSWSDEEIQAYKPLIKAEIEGFLDNVQQDGQASGEQVQASEQMQAPEQMQGSQVALGKRKAAAAREAEPPAKMAKGSRNAAGEAVFDLSGGRRVTVHDLNGKSWVHLREFFTKDGDLQPGKKGIMLTPQQWHAAMESAGSVAEAAQSKSAGLRVDLGNNRQLLLREVGKTLCVDVREYYDKGSELAPGKKGINLQMEQWEALVAAAAGIESALAALGPAALDAPLVEAEAVKVESVKAEGKEEAAGPAQAPVKTEGKVEAAGPTCVSASNVASSSAAASAAPSSAAAAGCDHHQAGSSNGLPIMLSRSRRADVSEFKGKTFVNIREYYEKDGEWRPGQKGIALSPEQFQTLKGAAGATTEALQAQDTSYRLPISGRRVVRIHKYKNSIMVDIREMYEKESQELPGKKGISLVADQWSALVAGFPVLQAALP